MAPRSSSSRASNAARLSARISWRSGIDRRELFLTTKIWISNYGYENTLKSVDVSLKKLGTDYLDLVLLRTSRSPTPTAHGARSKSSTGTAWSAPSA